jgi:hypothetical protein
VPAQDRIHVPVRNALIKDGWTITAEPFTIEYEEIMVFADLAAEKRVSATQKRIVVVEIKSFLGRSAISELETALGQYQIYRGYLEQLEPDAELFLAVDSDIYEEFFKQKGIQLIIDRYDVALLIVDVTAQEIVKWTN